MLRILTTLCASAVIATIASLMPISRALACSCVGFTEEEATEAADAVFEGVAVARSEGDVLFGSTADPIELTFRVEKQVKGAPLPQQVTIVTAADGVSCGAEFQVGERWRVFARAEGPDLTSNLCAGNRLLDESAPSKPPAGRGGQFDALLPGILGLGFVGLLALAALLLFGVRPTGG